MNEVGDVGTDNVGKGKSGAAGDADEAWGVDCTDGAWGADCAGELWAEGTGDVDDIFSGKNDFEGGGGA